MREKYLDEYKEWIRNNENYILYDKHLIEWENYTNELYKYEHSKQKYDYAIEKEKEKIEIEKTKKFWNSLDGIEFEKNIGELFKNLGRKVEFTSVTGDQGVDLFIGKDTVVQCKAHEAQISPSVIREMYGSMIHFKKKKAIVISTGGFTKGCYDFAKGKPIELWDLDKIIEKAKSIRR
jgi:HJR/Mrr/RecB family endonuclease